MRIVTVIVLVIVGLCSIKGQEPVYSYLKGEFVNPEPKSLPEDLIKTDFNGDTIAAVIIKSPIEDLTFYGNVFGKPVKSPLSDGFEYVIGMSEGSRNLKIRSSAFHEVEVVFPKPIGSKELWEINVTGVKATEAPVVQITDEDYYHKLKIMTDPFVDLYIDEELVPKEYYTGNSYKVELAEGTHYITSKYSSKVKNYEYSQKVKVRQDGQEVDAVLSGTVIIKNGRNVNVNRTVGVPYNYKNKEDHTFEYESMLGHYILEGQPNSVSSYPVRKTIEVEPRSRKIYRIDEMATYNFLCYQGTPTQWLGFNAGICKNIGGFISYTTSLTSSITTPYGDVEFTENNGGEETGTTKATSMTLSVGPMIRLWHKLYLQVGCGWAYYLQTSEPDILTADYRYRSALSLNGEFFVRIKAFVIGAGYVHQFVKNAYNSEIANEVSFSVGIAF